MVDNQHRKITGYRELSEDEIAAMNALKAKERELLELLRDLPPGFDPRFRALARTHLETGFMWASRAVAKPATVEF